MSSSDGRRHTLKAALIRLLFVSVTKVVQGRIMVGIDPQGNELGWMMGLCYFDITDVEENMELEFAFEGHDVVQLPDEDAFEKCDMKDAKVLATQDESPFVYKISAEDAQNGKLFFACSKHCNDNQKLVVHTTTTNAPSGQKPPTSRAEFLTRANCDTKQRSSGSGLGEPAATTPSKCEAPMKQSDGSWFVSCLSESVTMTPGGVFHGARLMHTPYPTDRRVKLGFRVWEFVTKKNDGTLITVPINQLYLHHMVGNVVFGVGADGMANIRNDREFPENYGMLSGELEDWMIFHLIDLRGVDDTNVESWVECVECRCNRAQKPLSLLLPDTGGVLCCFNCSSIVPNSMTMDYYMRYNVSYWDITEDEVVQEVNFVSVDAALAVGSVLEYNVPPWQQLTASDRHPRNPKIHRLVREDTFEALFKHRMLGRTSFLQHNIIGEYYQGPKHVKLLRCVSHMHLAAVNMRLEDADTGEILCENQPYHPNFMPGEPWSRGTPGTSDGFLTNVSVTDIWPEKTIRANQRVRFVTDYDATERHTGVRGLLFVFYSTEVNFTISNTTFEVDLCIPEFCQSSLLPPDDVFDPLLSVRMSILNWLSSICEFSGGHCQMVLRNLLACATHGMNDAHGHEEHQDLIDFLRAYGHELVMDHLYKLLGGVHHKHRVTQDVKMCGSNQSAFEGDHGTHASSTTSQDVSTTKADLGIRPSVTFNTMQEMSTANVGSPNAWLVGALAVCIDVLVRT